MHYLDIVLFVVDVYNDTIVVCNVILCAVNVSAPLGLPRTLRHHTWWVQHFVFISP